jgi:Immunoglobulin I-set domain
MKAKNPTTMVLAAALVLCGVTSRGDIVVKVDSSKPWQGFNNVTQTNGFAGYVFGSGWAVADLRANFIPTNSPTGWPFSLVGVMRPNTNTYNPTNIFWNQPSGTGNKLIEANWYVDVFTNFQNTNVTFQGTIISNNIPLADLSGLPSVLPSGSWQVIAFIKEFTAPSYGFVGTTTTTNLAPGAFSITRAIAPGHIAQYGFSTFGPNCAPGSPESLSGFAVVVEDADPAITTQPVSRTINSGSSVNLGVRAFGGSPLSFQWKRYGTNLSDGGNISGVTTTNLVISNAQTSDTGPYLVTVTDSAGSLDSQVANLTVLDIVITNNPVSQRVEQGSTVVMTVGATSSSPITYQWKSVINSVTNNLVNGPNVAGATSPTLTLSNVQTNQTAFYLVVLSGTASTGASLLVKTYAEYSNFLENPGFENDPTGVNESPWIRFQTSDPSFGRFQSTNDTYQFGGNVNVFEGNFVSYTAFGGDFSGIFQDVVASPGQIFAADMSFYNASGDPIPGPPATNQSFLEVQFRAGPTVMQQYITRFMDANTPQNVWLTLPATNAGTFGTIPPTSNAKYLVAPPGTTAVRFQVTMHDIAGSSGFGSLYYDSAHLMLKIPTTLKAVATAGNVDLSWKTQGATSYQVQYKTNLMDAVWTDVEVVAGTGTNVVKSYPRTPTQRFYRVLTL